MVNETIGYLEEHYETTEDLIQALIKRLDSLERRIENLEANQISESDMECYAEGLGLLDDEVY